MLLLELINISHIYKYGNNKVEALKNINLKIFCGDLIGIIGSTGSGKSTLAQIMNGVLKPTSGKIYFRGREVLYRKKELKELRKKVGLLFQFPEHQLFAETVEKDVAFGPQNFGFPSDEVLHLVKSALEDVGLSYEDYKNRSPFSLSGGEQRRVALAGVLAYKPEILVLDEPTAGLDPSTRKSFMNFLKNLQNKKNVTVVMISHKLEDLLQFAKRLVMLDAGEIVFDEILRGEMPHIEKIKDAGLQLPLETRILSEMKNKGITVRENLFRVEDVENEIIKLFREER